MNKMWVCCILVVSLKTIWHALYQPHHDKTCLMPMRTAKTQIVMVRGVIDKFVSFFHKIIIYGWIYIIFFHYLQQSVVNRKKTLKCKERQTCDVTMTLMPSHVADVVVKTLEDRYGWCILSGYKCYSTSAITVKFSDNICT